MATIDELKSEQLKNLEIFEQIKELADSFIFHVQAKEAYFLQEKLKTLLEASDVASLEPELYKNYQDLLAYLKWVALLMLPNEEVLKVLKESYLMALENEDVDVLDRIEAKMFSLGLMPRNELRREMQGALKENKEKLGTKTFGEWLVDYSKTFDFRDRDEFSPVEYVRQSSEAQALSESEKNKLRKALRLFDRVLLVTPVVDEFALGLLLRDMIRDGTIKKEDVNPALLQSFSIPIEKPEVTRILTETAARRAREIEKAPEEKPKPKKPAGLRPVSPGLKKPTIPTPPPPEEEKVIKEAPILFEGKISPYERRMGVPPKPSIEPTAIPTFPKELEKASQRLARLKQKKVEAPLEKADVGEYKIRTMKQDVEKAKKQVIPQKPRPEADQPWAGKPKIKNNIVDLSGK